MSVRNGSQLTGVPWDLRLAGHMSATHTAYLETRRLGIRWLVYVLMSPLNASPHQVPLVERAQMILGARVAPLPAAPRRHFPSAMACGRESNFQLRYNGDRQVMTGAKRCVSENLWKKMQQNKECTELQNILYSVGFSSIGFYSITKLLFKLIGFAVAESESVVWYSFVGKVIKCHHSCKHSLFYYKNDDI